MFSRLFERKPKIEGSIAYYDLISWWISEFTPEEQNLIASKYQPMGGSGYSLIEGKISSSSQSAAEFLLYLAGWFNDKENRHLARKILLKSESLLNKSNQVLSVHFFLQQKIEIFYKDRENSESYEIALQACRDQISLAPQAAKAFLSNYKDSPLPSHRGYQQLAIALEKEGLFQEAINTCNLAKSQGWAGDWEKRIERNNKKLAKA